MTQTKPEVRVQIRRVTVTVTEFLSVRVCISKKMFELRIYFEIKAN